MWGVNTAQVLRHSPAGVAEYCHLGVCFYSVCRFPYNREDQCPNLKQRGLEIVLNLSYECIIVCGGSSDDFFCLHSYSIKL